MKLSLLDTIKLRKTSVYSRPKDISFLNIPYGDLSGVQIPCTQIDADSRVFHASDVPIQLIKGVFADGEPVSYGFTSYTAYKDETGRSIACVVFDNPQYDKKITISCKGAIDLDTGNLIEYPADIVTHLMLTVQGYDADSIDAAELARFYSTCLKEGIVLAFLLNDGTRTIKNLMDDMAQNIHAHWLLSANKSVMRLRNVTYPGVPFPFIEKEVRGLGMTSEELINEITLNFNYDYGSNKYLASITKHNPISKRINESVPRSFDCSMLHSTRQAERTVDSMLQSYSFPAILASFGHNIKSLAVEVGDPCTISHVAGIGENGFEAEEAMVISKDMKTHDYTIMLQLDSSLYESELLSLTTVAESGSESINISYENGVATITIYADIQGNPPVEGAEVTISGVRKITDKKGQVRFNLTPGRYTAQITASGYENAEITFSV
jgi:hypothetical protein